MLKPIFLENDTLLIHPFRPEDLGRFEDLSSDIFSILSDDQTLKFIPGKRLNSLQEAELFLQTMVMNYHSGHNYIHFITHKQLDKVIGIIDLISPEVARQHYQMDHYPFFIEFYLSGFASGCYIMTEILPQLIDNLSDQGISKIGAVVNRKNIAARKVLEKANFRYKARFDMLQDLYETTN
ncbi:GNAT family N-acetyltransferase [Pedobacter hiemivivus]|uniref:N-acetyltransferase n=1 Tax=Pedobacter hiemivivus TaxID=2530454 RepID=A0A4V2MK56_9SPHI|nr:GNAT family N-acetyltransferase [Pedobacter hiemivivus]TCC96926.1 N-acetyltransferase [Pedobacter hiemivivus]